MSLSPASLANRTFTHTQKTVPHNTSELSTALNSVSKFSYSSDAAISPNNWGPISTPNNEASIPVGKNNFLPNAEKPSENRRAQNTRSTGKPQLANRSGTTQKAIDISQNSGDRTVTAPRASTSESDPRSGSTPNNPNSKPPGSDSGVPASSDSGAGNPPGGKPPRRTSQTPPDDDPNPSAGDHNGNEASQPIHTRGQLPKPTPPRKIDLAVGQLASAFGLNINPSLRRISSDIQAGSLTMSNYPAAEPENELSAHVSNTLAAADMPESQVTNASARIVALAKELDMHPSELAVQLANKTTEAKNRVASIGPRQPLLVDSGKNRTSVQTGSTYFTDLMSHGVPIGARSFPVALDDGTIYDVFTKPKLQLTSMNSDIDGPLAASYGMKGLDIKLDNPDRTNTYVHLPLDEPLNGSPVDIPGVELRANGRFADLRIADDQGNQTRKSIPIRLDQANAIGDSQSINKMDYVEGLTGRLFPPESVAFLKNVSERNDLGAGELPGKMVLPKVKLNTFGSMGNTAFENPGELVTSAARSLPIQKYRSVPAGLYGFPHVTVYSGGSAITKGSRVAQPFGLSDQQAQAMQNVARRLPDLVTQWSEKYGLSDSAKQAWQAAIFANPDIPSIIIPEKAVAEFSDRNRDTHLGKELKDLQAEIENTLQSMVRANDMGNFIQLHHTPSIGDDQVAIARPGSKDQFTTEWQFAVFGQKALAVLDSLSNDLKNERGIDLKAELEQRGYSYGNIREMGLAQTLDFFKNTVRPIIESHGENVTGKIIVPIDTYSEKNGKLGGSDKSLVAAAAALYGPHNVQVIQVDTAGGRPMQGRAPAFELDHDPAQGGLHVARPSVNPNGANGALAPTAYVTTAGEMGFMLDQAYKKQLPLTAAELSALTRRENQPSTQ